MHPKSEQSCVLVVDDDRDVLNALEFALGLEGYEVGAFSTASALAEASARARAHSLLIVQHLPDMSGLDLIRRLRLGGVSTPAVLITSQLPLYLQSQALLLEVPVVEKPLLTNALFSTIRRLIERPR